MFRYFTQTLLLLCFAITVHSQVITADPAFPTAGAPVTIYFDATQGTGGLANCNCDVYLHTGVITSLSTSDADWKHVVTTWGQANPAWKMTPVSGQPNKYSYVIQPTIKDYYGVTSPTEIIEKMAFVFRNGTGSLEGKGPGGTDIFYEVYPDNQAFNMTLVAPAASAIFTNTGAVIAIEAIASQIADFQVIDNGNVVHTANGTTLSYGLNVSIGGTHIVEVTATNGTDAVSQFFNYVVPAPTTTQALPAGTDLGINYLSDTSVRLAFYAPNKLYAYLLGDFNNWQFEDSYQMKHTPDSTTWWIDVTGLTPGQFYAFQYVVTGNIRIGDPYSNLILDPSNDQYISSETFPNIPPYPAGKTTGIASLLRTAEPSFDWQHDDYARPAEDKLVIYEILMRDFTKKQNYATLTDTLDYLQRLGVNAIELMPVNEFDGNLSWGYNPTYHYALDKYYGTPAAFQTLVDACHERGIAVILDVVFNHAHEKNPLCMLYWDAANFRPAADNPWLNQQAPHDFSVFYDFNHESPATKVYVRKTLQHWLNNYHVDGFRFDLSKGLTQNTSGPFDAGAYDAIRIATIKDYADAIWDVDADAYVILEHFTANTEEKELSDYGAMLWGGAGISNQFLESSMGYASNLSGASYKSKGWTDPHLIAYMESHDEERLMFKNISFGNSAAGYSVKDLSTALDRAELTSVFYLSIPGPKMLWQFFEMGYDFSINRCEDGTINNNCRLSPKPIRWDYMANPDRVDLWNVVRKMNWLRTNSATFQTANFQMNTSGFQKTMQLNAPDMDANVLGNFAVATSNITPNFQHPGWWYDYFTGDSLNVTDVASPLSFNAGEYRLYTDVKVAPPGFYTDAAEVAGQSFDWLVSPNPTSGEVTIDLVLDKNAEVQLTVFDAQGRQVLIHDEERLAAGQQRLALSLDMGAGLYFVCLNVDGEMGVRKVVVR
ncbi:MAG: T9SS type A sorting domain-containing protein [Saprospiraceae bacterium]|nr:T9SS type A sorting domain-containing protein [Saprospiraceae bacterium]MCF8250804.1 T9SS type A sorting domain-containing protein [Saprospiraceae bacterium]MCF8283004.1 T9SS type A sorting domain-containing protein [Bacteroidales bacterium]MCF8312605.1 T9SS type A sorting domain-containing protein [Saprospiraceae bacterium]MCF8440934.1 T9SS type A sorting domain-containing protein [Saprospiraceae bacterium]